MKIAGFDWDNGNWPNAESMACRALKIEQVLLGNPAIMADPRPDELRLRAIGKTKARRMVFIVFMCREIDRQTWLRPISARYMHQKEIDHYDSPA